MVSSIRVPPQGFHFPPRTATCVIAPFDSTATQFDLKLTGVDDQIALQDAIIANPGRIHILAGNVNFSMGLGRSDNTEGLPDNWVLSGDGDRTIFNVKNQAATTLTAQANAGQKIITVASTAGFTVGEWIEISTAGGAIIGTEDACYIARIDSPTQMTMEANLAFTHAIGRNVFSSWCTFDLGDKTRIILQDFKLNENGTNWPIMSVLGCRHMYGIQIGGGTNYSHYCEVNNITVTDTRRAAIVLVWTTFTHAYNCRADGALVIQGGNNAWGNSIERCVVTGADSAIVLEFSSYSDLLYNTVYDGSITAVTSTVRNYHCRIIGNKVMRSTGTQGGMNIVGFNLGQIKNNDIVVKTASGHADFAGMSLQYLDSVEISGNQVTTFDGTGTANVFGVLWNASIVNTNFENNIITGTWRTNRGMFFNTIGTGNTIRNNHFGGANTITFGVESTGITMTNNTAAAILFPAATSLHNGLRNNVGRLAKGEVGTHTITVTSLAENAITATTNPWGTQNVMVDKIDIRITTGAAAAATIDSGIGGSNITDYTTMFENLTANVTGFYRSTVPALGKQTVGQLWEGSGGTNRFLNISIKDAAATGMVCLVTIWVVGL